MNRGGKFLHHNSKFLRPGPAAYSDGSSSDDDSDANEDAEEEETKMPPPPSKKSSNANLSSSDEGSDADEEEDDDDEPEPSSKRSRSDGDKDPSTSKSKRPKPSFFDEEAEASDDDEGEEEEYGTHHDPHDKVKKHYTDDDIRRENMDREAMEIIERQNRRRNHLSTFTTDDSAEDIARQIEMRHRLNSRRVDRTVLDDASIVDGNQNLSAVTQQSLLPSVSDPSLWMFNCPAKKEQEMVYQIMNKCIAYARQGKPLAITSAIAGQSKGRVYIESYSEPAVREAVQGINGLMAYSMRLVPINDMTTVMTVTAKKKPGEFLSD
jgi:transcription elongation factor SPT5